MAGTLSATITPASVSQSGTATFTGVGALGTAAMSPVYAMSTAFTGTATLAATGKAIYSRSAPLAGVGSLAATGSQKYAPTPVFAATGALSATVILGGYHYTDNFNRANSTTSVGTNWTNRLQTMGINTNAAYPVAAADCRASYNGTMVTDNHSVSIVVGSQQSSAIGDACVCIVGANSTGQAVILYFDGAGNTADIMTITSWGNTGTSQASRSSVTYTTGDTLKLSRTGNVYTATKNGAAIGPGLTWTDSTNIVPRDSSHRIVGIGGYNLGGTAYKRIDSFAADDL